MTPARAFFKFSLLVSAVLLLGSTVVASTPPSQPPRSGDDAGRVVFGADANYAPFDYIDESGNPTGFDVELFKSVAGHAGLRVDYRLGNWKSILAELNAGTIDVVPMLVTPERERFLRFTEPYLYQYHLAFGPQGGRYIGSLDELRGARVAVQAGTIASESLGHVPNVKRVFVDVESHGLEVVAEGRADYAIVTSFVGFRAQRELRLQQKVVPLSAALMETGYAFAVAPGRELLLSKINAGLRKTTESGERGRLYVDWLANLTPPSESYLSGLKVGLWMALPLLGVSIVLLVWWRRARKRAAGEAFSRKRAEAQALHLEHHDPVTNLANRGGFLQQLTLLLPSSRPICVIRIALLDIGTLEAMADHAFVEQLLLSLAERLRERYELVANINDRGFLIATFDVADENRATDVMQSVQSIIRQRAEVQGQSVELITCAGAALYPGHGATAEELMRAASVASEKASAWPGSSIVYRQALAPDVRRVSLLTDLRAAIRSRSLGYALQPKLNLSTGRLAGAEMLVRWTHPTLGVLSPNEFISIAENGGVIGEMTLFLVEAAVSHCRDFAGRGLDLSVSVNVSVNDLADRNVVDRIVDLASGAKHRLILEVTETAVMRDPDEAVAAVSKLRDSGVRISLDDFGTGNSSLIYLRRLAPWEVKIDKSFVSGLPGSVADLSIVNSTIELAHNLAAVVTAEGVEDLPALRWLQQAGCDMAQGFYISYPLPPARFLEAAIENAGLTGTVGDLEK